MRLDVGNSTLAAAIVAADVLSVAHRSNTVITFVADSVASVSAQSDAASQFWSFSRVIRALERGGHTLISICPTNLVLIDGRILIPIGSGSCEPIVDGKVRVYAPPKPGFLSPELAAVKVLPATIDYRSIYYSIAAFLLHTHGLQSGKLHYALTRCLDIDPDERSLAVV